MSEAKQSKARFKCRYCNSEVVVSVLVSEFTDIVLAECPVCESENSIRPEEILEEEEELDVWEEEQEDEILANWNKRGGE